MEDINSAKKNIKEAFVSVYKAELLLNNLYNRKAEDIKKIALERLDEIYNYLDSAAMDLNIDLHQALRDEGIQVDKFEE